MKISIFSFICGIIRYLLNATSARRCSQCDSRLILVSKITETPEGSRFPQTTSIFKCSNKECQAEREKETAKRIKLKKEKDVALEKRIKEKLELKKVKQALL